jgi:serine/threonine protein kinase
MESVPQSENDPLLGQTLNGYKNIRQLDGGTFGRAYLAVQESTGKNYAIKIQNKMDEKDMHYAMTSLFREIHFLSENKHPFIIGYIEVFTIPGDLFNNRRLVLQYADA